MYVRALPVMAFMIILLLVVMPGFPFFTYRLLSGASIHTIPAEDAFLKSFSKDWEKRFLGFSCSLGSLTV